MIRSRLLPLR